MRTRTLKQLLVMTAVLLLTGTVVAAVLGFKLPINVPDVTPQSVSKPTTAISHKDTQRVPQLATLKHLARKDLRQRLFDPPPEPAPVIPPKPLPSIRLLGTIVNASNPQAMVTGKDGKTELKRIGDDVGDTGNTAVITHILTDHIKVEHDNKTLDVFIETDGERRR